jgi:hypothetical protein
MKPELFTTRSLIRRVPERWRKQYGGFDSRPDDKRDIYERLLKLDMETCSEADVAAIIGNGGWTRIRCDGCDRDDVKMAVQVGQEPDYESATATLCFACMSEAFALFDCAEHEDCREHPALGRACFESAPPCQSEEPKR